MLLKCTVGAISCEGILEKVGWALSKILYTPLTTSTWLNGPGDALVSDDGFFREDAAADAGDGIAGRGGACDESAVQRGQTSPPLDRITAVHTADRPAPIAMQFGTLSRVGPGNHVLDGSADAATDRGTFQVSSRLKSTVKQRIWELCERVRCAQTSGPILTICRSYDVFSRKDVPFGASLIMLPT